MSKKTGHFVLRCSVFLSIILFVSQFSFSQELSPSVDILLEFIASGYMGDTRNIELYESWKDIPCDTTDADSFCVKITYKPGDLGWAGIYWQNSPNNWGSEPGNNYSTHGFNQIEFWAKGENGGELVEFKAGGTRDLNLQYRDSFTATLGRKRLTNTWTRYTISLANKDLSNVIGGFCWVASGTANTRGITFYIDKVTYKKVE